VAEIVNLRQARKRRTRAEKDAQAEQNRMSFGRTRAEREASAAKAELEARRLEGHRRDGGEDA